MATIKEYRRRQARKRVANSLDQEGVAGLALGENPLTIWLFTAVVIVFLYIRRSHIGVDLHPAEKPGIKSAAPRQPKVKVL